MPGDRIVIEKENGKRGWIAAAKFYVGVPLLVVVLSLIADGVVGEYSYSTGLIGGLALWGAVSLLRSGIRGMR